jgi:hypothetical protein
MIVDIFSIKTMSNIFKECNAKLSYGSMQLYQNILQHYFSDKEEVIGNLNEFKIKQEDIPNYSKYKNLIDELESAKLIKCNGQTILFYDKWTKHIQFFRMIANHKMNFATDFKDEMYNSHSLIEVVAMKLGLKKADVNQLLQLFFAEQEGIKKEYPNESECRKHFIYWSQHNISKVHKTSVKSNSKILGKW